MPLNRSQSRVTKVPGRSNMSKHERRLPRLQRIENHTRCPCHRPHPSRRSSANDRAQNDTSGVLADGKRARRRGLAPRREPAYRACAASSNVYGTYPSLVESQLPGNRSAERRLACDVDLSYKLESQMLVVASESLVRGWTVKAQPSPT